MSPLSLLFSRLSEPSSLSCSSEDLFSRPFISLIAFLWPCSSTSVSFLQWGPKTKHSVEGAAPWVPITGWQSLQQWGHPSVSPLSLTNPVCSVSVSWFYPSPPSNLVCHTIFGTSQPIVCQEQLYRGCSSEWPCQHSPLLFAVLYGCIIGSDLEISIPLHDADRLVKFDRRWGCKLIA